MAYGTLWGNGFLRYCRISQARHRRHVKVERALPPHLLNLYTTLSYILPTHLSVVLHLRLFICLHQYFVTYLSVKARPYRHPWASAPPHRVHEDRPCPHTGRNMNFLLAYC